MNKAHLKRLAAEVRAEIGLDPFERFDPYALAAEFGVRVFELGSTGCSEAAIEHFHVTNPSVFSGALIPVGSGAVIIENEMHDPRRRRSTMAHEMAHVVLEHSFNATLVNERKCRTADPEQEKQAAELGGELLVTHEAAKRLAFRDATDERVAERYDVSVEIARWRMNGTGARRYVQNCRAKRMREDGNA